MYPEYLIWQSKASYLPGDLGYEAFREVPVLLPADQTADVFVGTACSTAYLETP